MLQQLDTFISPNSNPVLGPGGIKYWIYQSIRLFPTLHWGKVLNFKLMPISHRITVCVGRNNDFKGNISKELPSQTSLTWCIMFNTFLHLTIKISVRRKSFQILFYSYIYSLIPSNICSYLKITCLKTFEHYYILTHWCPHASYAKFCLT